MASHSPRVARAAAVVLVAALACGSAVLPAAPPDTVAEAARGVVDWLVAAREHLPEGVLPSQGSVRFHLRRLAPVRGSLGSAQATAVLGDVRARARGGDASLIAVDVGPDGLALVRARLTPPDGGPVDLLLSFREEDGAWRLREIREATR